MGKLDGTESGVDETTNLNETTEIDGPAADTKAVATVGGTVASGTAGSTTTDGVTVIDGTAADVETGGGRQDASGTPDATSESTAPDLPTAEPVDIEADVQHAPGSSNAASGSPGAGAPTVATMMRASEVTPFFQQTAGFAGKQWKTWNLLLFTSAAAIATIVCLAVLLPSEVNGKEDGGVEAPPDASASEAPSQIAQPTPAPTSSRSPSSNPSITPATMRLMDMVAGLYDPSTTNFELTPSDVLDDPASPQSLALEWLTTVDATYVDATYPDAGKKNDGLLLQRYALTQLYYATSGANWTSKKGFLTPNANECDVWKNITNPRSIGHGVEECDSDGRVTVIDLGHNNLNGTLPEELSLITSLKNVIFENSFQGPPERNTLYGPLPGVYSAITGMSLFYVGANQLTGTIPNEWGSGWNETLEFFNVCGNEMTGTIPSTLASSTKLKRIFLSDNDFDGTMPTEFCELPLLNQFFIHGNNLTGSVECMCSSPSNITADPYDYTLIFFSDCETKVDCSCCTYCA